MKFKNNFLSLFGKQKAQERSRKASKSQSTARFCRDDDNVEFIQEGQAWTYFGLLRSEEKLQSCKNHLNKENFKYSAIIKLVIYYFAYPMEET